MVRQREFDKEKALDEAMVLFWEKGYRYYHIKRFDCKNGNTAVKLILSFWR